MPCEDEGGDEGDVSTCQETPKLANRTPEARQRGMVHIFSHNSLKEPNLPVS